jgi:CRP-like cAMP-binding protein
MISPHNPQQNHLLAALTPSESARLMPHLELVPMPLGEGYYETGDRLQHVYFPSTSIVSLHYVMENGASAEVASIGNEGVLGISLFMGGGTTPNRASVRAAGFGYKLKAQLLLDEFNRGSSFQHLLLRYTQALMTETAQTAVCNRHHTIEQQLCFRLLLTLDRSSSNELVMTQEMAANLLGVRREGITEVAGRLQRAGYIQYRRGHITVLDRTGLEDHACECYDVVKAESDRLLGNPCNQVVPLPAFATLQERHNWHQLNGIAPSTRTGTRHADRALV